MKFIGFLILTVFMNAVAQGQTCSGNFGDAVVNLDFGSGSNPAPTSSTNYTYTTNNCPNDGSYTITSSTQGCFGNNWHNVNQDHTPDDSNGFMMLVNASNSPGEFFKQSIDDLCPGTTYEFAAFVLNVLRPSAAGIKPNLTFIIESVDGTSLGKYSTGDIIESAAPEWKKHALIFTTPSGISQIILKIINNAPGGNGNDLALDDITFRACGPTIQPTVNGSKGSFSVCEGQSTTISLEANVSSGFNNPAYQWQVNQNNSGWKDIPGANSKTSAVQLTSVKGASYQYRLAAAESLNINSIKCRIFSEPVSIKPINAPKVDAGPDKSTTVGRPVKLDGKVNDSTLKYLWIPAIYLDDPTKTEPVASPVEDITYTLQVTNECNIIATDQVFVRVYKEIAVPNAFTPNGDGMNDAWNIAGLISYPEATVKVFNRYGTVVFSSVGYNEPWVGKFKGEDLPESVYYYIIDLNNGEEVRSGSVSILK